MMPLVCFKLPAELWALVRRNVEMVVTPERSSDFMELSGGGGRELKASFPEAAFSCHYKKKLLSFSLRISCASYLNLTFFFGESSDVPKFFLSSFLVIICSYKITSLFFLKVCFIITGDFKSMI